MFIFIVIITVLFIVPNSFTSKYGLFWALLIAELLWMSRTLCTLDQMLSINN